MLPSYTAVTAQAIAYSLANADSYTRPHLWTHQFDAMAADVAQAYDLNFSRTLEDRPQDNLPFIYDKEFNRCVRMAFVRDLQINIKEGTKDLGPTNLERVRTLDDHPGVPLVHAPQPY